MTGWSLQEAIVMERRHVLEGERRIARQEVLAAELTGTGHDELAGRANDLLKIMRDTMQLSRDRLRYLEEILSKTPFSD